MKRIPKWTLFTVSAFVLAACNQKQLSKEGAIKRTVFLEKTAMDTTIKAVDDFYLYANGTWLKNEKIPASEVFWSTFGILREQNNSNLHKILNRITKQDNPAGSKEQKVADFYISGMDTIGIEKLGYAPIKPLLEKVKALSDYKEIISFAADSYKNGDSFLLGFYVDADSKNSSVNAAQFDQAGLSFPSKDYYFKKDPATVKIRTAFINYVTKLFVFTGVDSAVAIKKANDILKLETAIAKSHLTPTEKRDPIKTYNKFLVDDFQKQIPDIDLKDAFKRMGLNTSSIIVQNPLYLKTLNALLKSYPVAIWKDKIALTILSENSGYLSKKFRDANFNYKKVFFGQQEQNERWKIITAQIDGGLTDLLGQLYVEKYFTDDAKHRMRSLTDNLKAVYKKRIEKLDWMSQETKVKALAKLEAMIVKIGYTDKWKNYDDIKISKTTYYANLISINRHQYKEMIKKVGKAIDKMEWDDSLSPPTVNAGYNALFNTIEFPAGILQFPFFDKDADDAVNYGAIGSIIGHEMTHGFDDEGRQYDKDGNLKNWWEKADANKFKARADILIHQFNGYTVLNDLPVNGSLTLGENLADLGGVAIAYEAFKNTPQGKNNKKIDGFTPDQRFFLSFAQAFRGKSKDEFMRYIILNDPHSPNMYRVNGTLSNTPEFYKAFGVKPGNKLYRSESQRVKVW